MDYKKIVEEIKAAGVEASLVEVTKGSAVMTGITLGEGCIRPTVYQETFGAVGTEEEIALKIVETYKGLELPDVDKDAILSEEYIKENMFVALRRPLPDKAFSKSYLDMQMVLRVKIPGLDDFASYVVNKDLAERYGFDESIFDEAVKNTEYVVKSLAEVLLGMLPPIPEEDMMYYISNAENRYGASAICDMELLEGLAERLNSDLAIIPSSTQEVLVVKYDAGSDLKTLSEMVMEVNGQEVEPDEQLSDHAYVYLRGSKQLTW